ncbi:YicC family protein [soil metagenome]
MIRSMTGYGEAEVLTAAGRVRVEVRTVNHRYLNVNARLPVALARFEPELREWLRGPFSRGHVNCTVRIERDDAAAAVGLRLDEERISGYLALFREMTGRFGIAGTPDLSLISRFNDVFIRADPEGEGVEIRSDELREVVVEAAAQTNRMRDDEGLRLQRDLEERVEAIESALQKVESLAPDRLRSERDRLHAAVRELLGGLAVDEARVAQEIAFLAERWDLNEELVRFRSHLELLRDLVEAEREEAVGKRLGFLVQEMHREANTIGAKANSAQISHQVVAIKDEIERLREQVENVE